MKSFKTHIGTSGWMYQDWKKVFYPQTIKTSDWLRYYAEHFSTTEINNSFYRLPSAHAFESWRRKTPLDFVFSVKLSRYITHIKRMKSVKREWNVFLRRALRLKNKLGPILVQFPRTFVLSDERFDRLQAFLSYAAKDVKIAVEFRDSSWADESVCELMKEWNCSYVMADSINWPYLTKETANFGYVRMHGPKDLFSSNYSNSAIKRLSDQIRGIAANEVFVYFNNDAHGYAIKNAKMLTELVKNG